MLARTVNVLPSAIDLRAVDASVGALVELDEARVVRDGRAVVGGGARDGEREARVVGLRVVVHVRRGDPVGVAASACSRSASSFETRLCSLPMRRPPVRS